MSKLEEYEEKVTKALSVLFDSESDLHIDHKDMLEHINEFIHVLSTTYPKKVYNAVAPDKIDSLKFNHFTNGLVFHFSEIVKEK